MADLKFEIIQNIGTISESAKGWSKEINLISTILEIGIRLMKKWGRVSH